MDNVIAYLLMAAITLPLSFILARGCLRGMVWLMSVRLVRVPCAAVMSGETRRDVL